MATIFPDYVDGREQDRAFDRICQAILGRHVDFLFGAGMSVDDDVPEERRVPTGKELAVRLLKIFFPPKGTDPPTDVRLSALASDFPFEAVVQAVEDTRGKKRVDLTDDLKRILLDPKFKPSQAHHDFLTITEWDGESRVYRVFTTNFDTLFEQVFDSRGVAISDKNTADIHEAERSGQIPIIHLHGTLTDESYKVTETDIFSRRFKASHMSFRAALDEADAFVFVGYSMNDPDFRRLYMEYREEIALREHQDKTTYVVSPAADQYAYDLGRHIWESRGAIWIPLTAKQFFIRLRELLGKTLEEKVSALIMDKYDLKDKEAYREKIARIARILGNEEEDAVLFLREARTKTGGRE